MGAHDTWTDEQIATLKRMRATGHSFSQVARAIGGGMSRNAVIGKAHRLGLDHAGNVAPRFDWTIQRIARLEELHAQGVGYTAIASTLGAPRANVLRKLQKLGLVQETSVFNMRRAGSKIRASGKTKSELSALAELKRAPKLPPEPAAPPDCDPVTLLNLEREHCRFPIGEVKGPETLFCGAAKDGGADGDQSYCRYHRLIATGAGTYSEQVAVKHAEKAAAA